MLRIIEFKSNVLNTLNITAIIFQKNRNKISTVYKIVN